MNEAISYDLARHQGAMLSLLQELDGICRRNGISYTLFAGTLLGAVRHGGFIPWDDDLDVLMPREDYARFLSLAETELDPERFFLQKEFSEHWPMFFSKLRLNGTACIEKFHPKDPAQHQGIYIDLFPCDNALENGFLRKLQFAASRAVIAKCLDRRGYDTDSRGKKLFMALCRALPLRPLWRFATAGRRESAYVHTFFGASRRFERAVYCRKWFASSERVPFEAGEFPIPQGYDALLKTLYGDYMRLPDASERAVKRHAILVDFDRSWEAYEHFRDGLTFDVYTRSIR